MTVARALSAMLALSLVVDKHDATCFRNAVFDACAHLVAEAPARRLLFFAISRTTIPW